ncbi:hypothetical protein HT031_002650 [Scenedesmus sp. PABB004]|nr:hypothetical protein HT031_002650 [Scenedesmus sp. PABB004]
MPAVASTLGALVGVGITCFKNGLQYLPVYRKPWEHLIAGGLGAYGFTWIAEQEDSMVKRIEEQYARFGQKPEN